ncbi:MAG: peptidoglycan DD-metalloendopeptidase family protein [Chitinophagaceae bacterium]|nr:peptidoglycan DD-metalloendopeptidase family protein [Chitinophagaceae bacterium]
MVSFTLSNILARHQATFHSIVPFNPAKDKLLLLDLTESNSELPETIFIDRKSFENYINTLLRIQESTYAIGGYGENRVIYSRSGLFNNNEQGEPRSVHLGFDIWGEAGTPVYAFMGGMVHSFAFNNNDGDYGATIILLHQLEGFPFYSLYGHLAWKDIRQLSPGQYVVHGQKIGHFGEPHENGNWPPHLHFQLIEDIELKTGDYPGVCKPSEKEKYLANCPDPDLVAQMIKYI